MTRIWMAVTATLALVLATVGVAMLVAAGTGRDHSMMDDVASDRGVGDVGRMMGRDQMAHATLDEYDYLVQMVAHHEEAIVAAEQLSRSLRPEMRELGTRIIESQSAQVAQMTDWLAAWYPGRPRSDDGYVPEMRDLTSLSGDALDLAFLTDMIHHHMMAVMSSQRLLMTGSVEHDAVGTLARTIRDEQRAEIVQMRRWLGAWFSGG